ncbi:hypothetical protein TIFTF001_008548 [Ficus carica]|uniref:Cytochrome P450 n=1 Tax=Ficus carica TaxID=3494 RepID=A0AA87ZLL6_FICCA|nr:hypothetical protein TIFTF001_008548 [Ficus carica]
MVQVMEWSWVSLAISLIIFLSPVLLHLLSRRRKSSGASRLPPEPPGWPVFGNMFDLGSMPHRTLAEMRRKYGDVLWLRLGAINTMAVLSSKAATELFKNHDMSFVERTVTETGRAHNFHEASVALAPYGPYWRLMRRLMTADMLVGKRVSETAPLRRRCVDDMSFWIEEEATKKSKDGVHVARFVFLMVFNLLGNMMLSRDLVDPNSKEGSEFFAAMEGLMEWSGHANVADFFPWLRRLDPQGLRRKMERDMGKAIEIVSKFVKERMSERGGLCVAEKKDFLDVLLDFESNGKDEPAKLTDHQLINVVLEMFLAGSESTSSSVEWALTELLLNPYVMAKAKAELTQLIGSNRKFQETDIDNLPYLNAVIKETLRLHPPIPLLVPRKATNDQTNFMGYSIPKNTQVFVNAWAIGRDADVWDDPLCFKPERFLNSEVDYKGQNYELIPFGAGRRICAGLPLAHRLLHLILGSLIHEFEWKLGGKVTRETMDMKDRLGIVSRKLEPLLAVPTKCIS